MTRQGQQPTADAFPSSPFRIIRPGDRNSPMLVASPHSGRVYTPAFLAASRLDPHSLRRSEDCFVDELFAGAPGCGVPLLAADFPRAYCDVNREPWELDPAMFSDKLPPWCNTRTPRINAGFGTVARLVASGQPIYAEKLCFAEAEGRIRSCWQPYHDALSGLIAETQDSFSHCILLDCHSMPTEEPASRPAARSGLRAGRRARHLLRPGAVRRDAPLPGAGGIPGAAQRSVCRWLRHAPLRPSASGRARAADRDQPQPLFGPGALPQAPPLRRAARADVGAAAGVVGAQWRSRPESPFENALCRRSDVPFSASGAHSRTAAPLRFSKDTPGTFRRWRGGTLSLGTAHSRAGFGSIGQKKGGAEAPPSLGRKRPRSGAPKQRRHDPHSNGGQAGQPIFASHNSVGPGPRC